VKEIVIGKCAAEFAATVSPAALQAELLKKAKWAQQVTQEDLANKLQENIIDEDSKRFIHKDTDNVEDHKDHKPCAKSILY
jgi:actin-related protein